MVEVRRTGSVLYTDGDGFLIPSASRDKIVPPWSGAVDHLSDSLPRHLHEHLHSGYVRGSVASGTAIEGVSDLDGVAVLLGDYRGLDPAWMASLKEEWRSLFPFCRGIEVLVLDHDRVMANAGMNRWGFLLATQSVNIFGEDLCRSLPRFRPGPLAVMHAPQLEIDLGRVLLAIAQEPLASEREGWCAWVMRRIVRAGFELVMEKEMFWTRDLYAGWEAFARHHPDRSTELREALELAVNPTGDVAKVRRVAAGIGSWVAERGRERYGGPMSIQSGNESSHGEAR